MQPHGNSNERRVNTDVVIGSAWDGTATNLSMKAAPGVGMSLYITDVTVIQGATSRAFSLLDGSGGTVLFKSVLGANAGQTYEFETPIKLTSNTALCLTSAGGSVGAMVLIGGFSNRG